VSYARTPSGWGPVSPAPDHDAHHGVRAIGPYVCVQEDIERFTQGVRLIDVLVLGPAMIYASTRVGGGGFLAAFLAVSGTATILFNAYNYLAVYQATRGSR
jgi:hypothetical protein